MPVHLSHAHVHVGVGDELGVAGGDVVEPPVYVTVYGEHVVVVRHHGATNDDLRVRHRRVCRRKVSERARGRRASEVREDWNVWKPSSIALHSDH